ncbi:MULTISPECIES: hypothetical protein [unclassified Brevundimonas]|uniref:hypothetical protein n=1 Tax=unclassified Brevundimonas TaxID=2622653 RepID=UPI0025B9F0B1|nr:MULTISPECIES: hypothetical protein [unclassified Brevundimonas]
MTTAFSIGEALASGFRLSKRRPLQVWTWGIVSVAPSLLMGALMLRLFGAIALTDMAGDEPSAEFVGQMIQFQALSGLANILQMLIWVVVTAAIFRTVLFPQRPAPFAGLRIGMDEVRIAVVGLALVVGFYAAAIVIALLAFAVGAGLWFVSEAAAVAVGLAVALAAGLAVWGVILRACLIMPASVALGDFAFVQGWRLSKGQVLRLLGLSLAIVAVVLAIELALLAIVAVVLFLAAGLNVFSLAAMLEQGAPPTVDWGVLIPWALAAFVPLSWLQGFLSTVMMAPYAEACRSLLAQAPQDEARPVALG